MKLVLTGGPSGGKTTLANLIQKEFGDRVVIIPEAASILFGGGFPRRPGIASIRHRQKAIYFVQRELEGIVQDEFASALKAEGGAITAEQTQGKRTKTLLICDRGSLDGIAYWPDPNSHFLDAVESTMEKEMARYDFVLHLDTAPEANYDITNPLRVESFQEAWALNERIKAAWAQHPRRFIIGNGASGHFLDKLGRALTVIHDVLKGRTYEEILEHLARGPKITSRALSDDPSPTSPANSSTKPEGSDK